MTILTLNGIAEEFFIRYFGGGKTSWLDGPVGMKQTETYQLTKKQSVLLDRLVVQHFGSVPPSDAGAFPAVFNGRRHFVRMLAEAGNDGIYQIRFCYDPGLSVFLFPPLPDKTTERRGLLARLLT